VRTDFDPIIGQKVLLSACAGLALLLIGATTYADVSKANLILINRGLQIQGMVTKDDIFHLSTYSNANYTSINWIWDSNPSLMGAAPGFPWARWVNDETKVPPLGSEAPYMSQLVSLQLGDEWNLNDATLRTRAVNWFNAIRTTFPNTILYNEQFRRPGRRCATERLHHASEARHAFI